MTTGTPARCLLLFRLTALQPVSCAILARRGVGNGQGENYVI